MPRNDARDTQGSPAATGPRLTGQIIRVVLDKGFGFIESPSIKGKDVFFHLSNCDRDLWNGIAEAGGLGNPTRPIAVTFESAQTEKGPRALNVHAA